jgi:hypothetical protein
VNGTALPAQRGRERPLSITEVLITAKKKTDDKK